MSQITVTGGKPLKGRVDLKGAKNLVTKAMVAALLGETPSVLKDVPRISDVEVVSGLLRLHGVVIDFAEDGVMNLDPTNVKSARMVDIDAHAGSSRIPILFCGPLLHQLGEAFIPGLGGCHIGDRPVDYHFEVLRNFGAKIEELPNGTRLTAPKGLKGAKINLPYPSVGATEQVLLTAVKAQGKTELSGAAIEPEIMDLIAILQKMGAIISVDADRVIRIEGVKTLNGYTHRALFDRNEAASWAAAALATEGDIFVGGARQQEMTTFLNVFRKVGGAFQIEDDGIRFWHPGGQLNSVVIETDVHPGFMTDWQQPLVVALTQANGFSIIHETVYEQRFGFTDALKDMGAQIQIYSECLGGTSCRFGQRNYNHSAVISGPTKLTGADIRVPDLRGGFSHMVAALAADGVSNVTNVQLISRGYENFLQKLADLGADFTYTE
jgi:UDP-N-acetylglucosamine 1-carboxyvinyltransferase